MKLNIYTISKFLTNIRGKLLGVTFSFSIGIIADKITSAETKNDIFTNLSTISNGAILLMLFLGVVTLLAWVMSGAFIYIRKRQNISAKFMRIMKEHTNQVLNEVGQNELSWGYNKNIHRCKDALGWKCDAFFISQYEDNDRYTFPKKNEELPGYSYDNYQEFKESVLGKKLDKSRNNMARFAAVRVKPNFNDSDRKVEIELKKTDWSSLQFSWDYMRRIDLFNHEILDKPNKAAVEKKLR